MACHGFPLGLSLLVAVPVLIPVGAGAAPDWSRLSLKGNGHVQDHFSLAVQAGARMLGRGLDYETLYVLSGNAFAPCLDSTESCTSWWLTGTGRDASADLIARRLGLRFRRIPNPGAQSAPPMPADRAALEQWLRDHWRVPAVPGIREALERGEVVLTSGRWSGSGPHGFTPWSWWGIIAEARDDGTVVGACLNGYRDNPMAAVDDMLALSLGTPGISQGDADFEVLCRAVSRVHGNAGPFRPGARTVYGLAAVDRWIERMGRVPFCPDCGDKSASCAHDTARPVLEGAKVAARYLQGLATAATPEAQPHLAAAGACYERIAALLHPAAAREGEGSYGAIIGDPTKQQAHVELVLRPVRAALARAADEMAAAVACSVPKTARLVDVPAGQGDGNGFARGLQVLLAQQGVTADYDTLMGDLGLAFTAFASAEGPFIDGALDAGWWPLEPLYCLPYLPFVSTVVGRRLEEWEGIASWQPDAAKNEDIVAQVRVARALAGGRAVLACHDFWKVVTGCDGEALPLLGFCACTPQTTPGRLPGPAWRFVAVGEATAALDRKEADREALRHIVALGRDEMAIPQGYVTGQKAWALWVATLLDLDHLGQARWHANMVLHLSLNRASAPVFLEQMAARHPAVVAAPLRAASEQYRQVLARLREADTSPAAMGGQAGRERLARLVDDVAALELRAVEELEAALAAAGT